MLAFCICAGRKRKVMLGLDKIQNLPHLTFSLFTRLQFQNQFLIKVKFLFFLLRFWKSLQNIRTLVYSLMTILFNSLLFIRIFLKSLKLCLHIYPCSIKLPQFSFFFLFYFRMTYFAKVKISGFYEELA